MKKEINWEERRYELTKVFAQILLQREEVSCSMLCNSDNIHEEIASTARIIADKVIKQLKKK